MVLKSRRIETVLKIAGNQNKNTIWAFLLYSLVLVITIFQQNYHNDQLVAKPNEMIGLNYRLYRDYLATERPAAIFYFCLVFPEDYDLSSEGTLQRARIFLVLESS